MLHGRRSRRNAQKLTQTVCETKAANHLSSPQGMHPRMCLPPAHIRYLTRRHTPHSLDGSNTGLVGSIHRVMEAKAVIAVSNPIVGTPSHTCMAPAASILMSTRIPSSLGLSAWHARAWSTCIVTFQSAPSFLTRRTHVLAMREAIMRSFRRRVLLRRFARVPVVSTMAEIATSRPPSAHWNPPLRW